MLEVSLLHERLGNGVELSFIDESNRYFGDYYRIRILAVCRFELNDELLASISDDPVVRQRLQQQWGATFEHVRVLSRMGVSGAEVETVKRALVEDFLATARVYMAAPDFPAVFLRRKLKEPASRPQSYYVPSHR